MARHFTNSASNNWHQNAGTTGPMAQLTACTISGWIKHASAQQSCIYGESEPGTNHYISIGMLSTHAAYFEAKSSTVTALRADSSTTTTTGVWAHVCGVKRSGSSRDVYLNGGGKVNSSTTIGVGSTTNSQIGLLTGSSGFNPANGDIGEVACWNVALDDAEVLALAQGANPLSIRPTSLARYWPLWGQFTSENNLVKDAGSNAFPGLTLTGTSAWSGDHPPVQRPRRRFVRKVTATPPGGGLFRYPTLSGLGSGGKFFHDPVQG